MNLQILKDVRTLDCEQYCDKLIETICISVNMEFPSAQVLHLIAQMQLLPPKSQESVIIRLTSFLLMPEYVMENVSFY